VGARGAALELVKAIGFAPTAFAGHPRIPRSRPHIPLAEKRREDPEFLLLVEESKIRSRGAIDCPIVNERGQRHSRHFMFRVAWAPGTRSSRAPTLLALGYARTKGRRVPRSSITVSCWPARDEPAERVAGVVVDAG